MGSRSDKKRRKPRRPHKAVEPPQLIPYRERFHPRGGRRGPWHGTYTQFRERLGLSDTRYVAGLLGGTVRSVQRREYQGPVPRSYPAARLGLRDCLTATFEPSP